MDSGCSWVVTSEVRKGGSKGGMATDMALTLTHMDTDRLQNTHRTSEFRVKAVDTRTRKRTVGCLGLWRYLKIIGFLVKRLMRGQMKVCWLNGIFGGLTFQATTENLKLFTASSSDSQTRPSSWTARIRRPLHSCSTG